MRIDAYSQISQIYKPSDVKKTAKTEKTAGSDNVVLSNIGKDMQKIKQAVANAPDVRADIVNDLKNKIDNNQYNVDASDFANMLLKKMQESY